MVEEKRNCERTEQIVGVVVREEYNDGNNFGYHMAEGRLCIPMYSVAQHNYVDSVVGIASVQRNTVVAWTVN